MITFTMSSPSHLLVALKNILWMAFFVVRTYFVTLMYFITKFENFPCNATNRD